MGLGESWHVVGLGTRPVPGSVDRGVVGVDETMRCRRSRGSLVVARAEIPLNELGAALLEGRSCWGWSGVVGVA